MDITHNIERFYLEQRETIKATIAKISTIQEALTSATVESFYNIMVNEVKNEQK